MKRLLYPILLAVAVLTSAPFVSAGDKEESMDERVKDAIDLFQSRDSSMKELFQKSYGYAVFPDIAKGAIGIGGAHGKGLVFEKGKLIGKASLSQATIGFQLGGQVYAEVIFFEKQSALEDLKANEFTFSAQVSAVAAAEGASANARYRNRVAVFTLAKGGLMYEASIGGQKFKFKPISAADPGK